MQSKGIFAETSMLIGLSNGNGILRQRPKWVAFGSARNGLSEQILSALMREHGHTVDNESFRILLTEVECVMNSRPLTVLSSDPEDLDPLTPNHIQTMKSRVVMPPPENFQKADLYLRKRWKRVQYLSNVF